MTVNEGTLVRSLRVIAGLILIGLTPRTWLACGAGLAWCLWSPVL